MVVVICSGLEWSWAIEVLVFSGPGRIVLVIFSGSALFLVSKKGEILLWPRARSRFAVFDLGRNEQNCSHSSISETPRGPPALKSCCGYRLARFEEIMLLWLAFWRGTLPVL